MPSRDIHKLINRLIFGNDGNDIHKYMDEPVKWLGKNHRQERHDVGTLAFLFATQGKEAAQHAATHIATDKFFSGIENAIKRELRNQIKKFISGNKF
jgi:hypothetical protein